MALKDDSQNSSNLQSDTTRARPRSDAIDLTYPDLPPFATPNNSPNLRDLSSEVSSSLCARNPKTPKRRD